MSPFYQIMNSRKQVYKGLISGPQTDNPCTIRTVQRPTYIRYTSVPITGANYVLWILERVRDVIVVVEVRAKRDPVFIVWRYTGNAKRRYDP